MFFLKKEDRPGRALPPAAHDSGRKIQAHRLGGRNPLGNSRGFRSWRVLGPILTLSWLIFAFKTPPRPSKTPSRASKTSKTPPAGGPKSLIFLVFFNVFAFQSYLDPTRPPRRLQEPPGRLQDAFKSLQDPSKSFQDGPTSLQDVPKSLQDAPRTFQDGSKTLPRERPKSKTSRCLPISSLSLAFLGPS